MSMTADRCNSVRLPIFEKSKRFALAISVLLVAGASMPTPAAAFGIGFGGISIRIPGGGFGGGHGYRHHGSGRHHGHHDDEDDSDSADGLTKGKPNDRDAVSKQEDLNPKGPSTAVVAPAADVRSTASESSTGSSALKPGPSLAPDIPTTETAALYEHGPDLTPER
jgi:hypothetical protein